MDAKEQFDRHLKLSDSYNETAVSLGKWLLSSFLAMNGAAVITVLGLENRGKDDVVAAGIAFSLGVAVAILGGMVTWLYWNGLAKWHSHIVQLMLHKPSPTAAEWEDIRKKHNNHLQRRKWLSRLSQVLAVLSALSLIVGTVILVLEPR
jgi:hypothetical protein